ncbi:MAG: tetratricopeptide repeat protein [Deltaproteobacteria bacterium]|nr:tetratricopeptide repeat protein [Deltaproteobacteria bacterium]
MRWAMALVVGALALAAPGVARAQTVEETDLQARNRFQAGREAFARGDFIAAAEAFQEAYALSQRPQLLYNLGTSYERLHRWEEAASAFRRYLDALPEAPDHQEVTARLRMIEVELEHRRERSPEVVVVERRVEVVTPPRPWRTAFWIAGSVSVVAAGVTLSLGLISQADFNGHLASGGCAQTGSGCPDSVVQDFQRRNVLLNVGLVSTGLLAAATVTFFVLDSMRPPVAEVRIPAGGTRDARRARPRRWALGAAPLADGALLTVGGAF